MSFSSGIWKKASLHRAWIAAHWDGKVTRREMMFFSVDECVKDMEGEKFALRISGYLLLGILRIFSRKVGYLLTDCQEVLVRIKLAFRPGLGDQAIINSNVIPEFDISNYDIRNFVCVNDSLENEVRMASRDEITLKENIIMNRVDVPDDNDLGGPMEDFEFLISLGHRMEVEVGFICSTGDELDRSNSTLERTTSMVDSGFGSPSFLDSDGFLSPSSVPPRLVRSLRGSNRSESSTDPIVSLQSTEDKTSPPSPDLAEPVLTSLPEYGSDVACCSTTTNGHILENDDDDDDDAMMVGNDETGFSDSDATVEMVDIWNVSEVKQNGVCEAGTGGVAGDILVPKFVSTPKHPTKVSSAKNLGTSRKRLLLETCTEVDKRIRSEASEKRRKRKPRRTDIIDIEVYVSRDMKNWKKNEIKSTVRPFAPAKTKEISGAEMLLGPGRRFISREILQVYKDSLVMTDHFSTSDGVSDSGESAVVGDIADIDQLDVDTHEDETTTQETRRSCNGSPVLFHEDSGFVSSLVNVPSNSTSCLDQPQVDELETFGAAKLAEKGGGTKSRQVETGNDAVDDTGDENDDRNEDYVETSDDVGALDDVEAPDDVGALDDVEEADDFRWNSRSLHMQRTLGRRLTSRDSVKFQELVSRDNRKQVAAKFYTLLFMKKTQMIEVRQDRSFGDILISRGSNFSCSC